MRLSLFKAAACAIQENKELETQFQMVDPYNDVRGAPHMSRNDVPYIRDLNTRKLWKVKKIELVYGYGPWQSLRKKEGV